MRTFICLNKCLVVALAAANFFAVQAAESLPQFSHPREVTNRFLPLASLKQDVLESGTARVERTVKPDVHKIFQVSGHAVEVLTVEDREFEKGKLAEIALDYFAQADDGTVYYFGEDVDEYKDGKVVGHSGAWLYGVQTQALGVLMPGNPKAGDKFKAEDVPKVTWEQDEIVSLSESVLVPAGEYRKCLKIKETLSDGKTEYKYYAPGVGCVRESEEDADFGLKSHNGSKSGK